MKPRHLVIFGCEECPHFDNHYYTYNEECILLDVKIGKLDYTSTHYPIPDYCPLQSAEEVSKSKSL